MRMSNRLKVELLVLALLAGAVMGAKLPGWARSNSDYRFFDPLVDVRQRIVRYYVTEPDENAMLEGAIDGMIDTLDDPYSTYFTAKQLESFEKQTRGTFSGIGAEIEVREGVLTIVSPLEDSPAFNAGIMAGDIILQINHEPVEEDITATEAVERITGPEGTKVHLKIKHLGGRIVDVSITRQRIEIQTVKGYQRDADGHWDFMLDPQQKIGYVRMTQFSGPTYEKLVEALDDLTEREMAGLILDLRYNPGGLLESAVQVADLFLKEGQIVSTRGRATEPRSFQAKRSGTLEAFPMIVLVNEGSASASEIVSGALKDNQRAIVLGTRTVGKGSVQQLMPLEGEQAGGVKLTTSHYYLPSGRNIHRREEADTWGVDPTEGYYVPMDVDRRIEMMQIRREGEILRPDNGDEADHTMPTSPEAIRQKLKDDQLAAAVQAMLGRLKDGQFIPTGQSNATLLAHLSERETLIRQQQVLEERLAKVRDELDRLAGLIVEKGGDPEQLVDPDESTEVDQSAEPDEAAADSPDTEPAEQAAP